MNSRAVYSLLGLIVAALACSTPFSEKLLHISRHKKAHLLNGLLILPHKTITYLTRSCLALQLPYLCLHYMASSHHTTHNLKRMYLRQVHNLPYPSPHNLIATYRTAPVEPETGPHLNEPNPT